MQKPKKMKPPNIITDIELDSSISSIKMPEEHINIIKPKKSTSCRSKLYTLIVILFISFCTIGDIVFHCLVSMKRSSKLDFQFYFIIIFACISLICFLRAIFTSSENFIDFDFLIAESLFDQMKESKLLNCTKELEKKTIIQDMSFNNKDELLMRILQNSKNFNSNISKIRSMIDGYHRGGDNQMPV